MIKLNSILAIACIAVLSACDCEAPNDPGTIDDPQERWEAWHKDSYQMTVNLTCFCTMWGDYRVTVKNGAITSAVQTSTGDTVSVTSLELGGRLLTIDDYFRFIDTLRAGEADSVRTEFHPQYGYPILIDIDYILEAIDDELTITISDLQFK
jgi:hypothetical protein